MADENISEAIDRVRDKIALEALAKRRYGSATPGASQRANRYRQAMKYYAPLNNDQWPEDKAMRPGKVHITANIVRAYCDITARLLSIPPRLVNKPAAQNVENRRRAEDIERFFNRLLDMTGWDVWLNDWALAGEIFGVGILKPYWNSVTNAPDVQVIEQPQNLMLGYGASDYSVIDWSIYQHTVSFIEAQSRWPDAGILLGQDGGPVVSGTPVEWGAADKADIVNQRSGSGATAEGGMGGLGDTVADGDHYEEYEHSSHLDVWDYWYRAEGKVYNATLLAGRIVDGPHAHNELPTIPYLIYEAGHEPGSPEGLNTVELLRDTQMGYNRALSLWTQYSLDNSGTAYQVQGPTSGDIPEGLIPQSDEMVAVGENSIVPIQRNQNTFPINQLIDQYWELAARLTGIPAILFGQLAGAQTSGRATAVQIEAALNRLDPKRRRFYQTFKDLLRIWGYMLSFKNSKIEVVEPAAQEANTLGPQAEEPELKITKIGMKKLLDGFDNWKVVAPEITPRDSIEATTNAANKVGAHLQSIESAMDDIGIEDPQHELDLIRRELADARLNPGQVQAYISSLQLLNQLMQQQAEQAAAAGQQGQDTQQAQDQGAQPTGLEDQNQPGTMPGGAPPPGTNAPGDAGLQLQGLIRQKGGVATPMSQVVLPPLGTK